MKKTLVICALSLFGLCSMAQIPQGFTLSDSKVVYKVEKSNPDGGQVKEDDMIFAAFSIAYNDSVVMNNLTNKKVKEPTFLVSKRNNIFKGDLMDGLLLMRSGEEYTFAFPKDSMTKIQRFPEGFEGWVYYRVRIDSICSYNDFLSQKQKETDSLRALEQTKIDEYLQKNSWDKAIVEGVYVKVLNNGVGEKAKNGDEVKINYIGQLLDGKVFDTSLEDVAKENNLYNNARKYEPLAFEVGAGQMIRGFEIAARMMNKGTKLMVLIPSSLAYGERNMGAISPYSPLVFTMEMVDIQEGKIEKTEKPDIKSLPAQKNKNNTKKTNKTNKK